MISRFFIDRPIFASVLSIVITLAGGVSVRSLPIAQYPEITPPTVQVICNYPGANAQVVADTVAAPIEQQVNGVENMLYMQSQCTNDGAYNLTVTFNLGTNLNTAQVLVQNRVSLANPTLPDVVQRQGVNVKKKSPNILLAVNLISPDGRYDDLYLSNYATIQIKDELFRLPGVGDINFLGERDYSIRAWLDPQQMAARNLSTTEIVNAINYQNAPVPAGQIGQPPMGFHPMQYPIRALGRLPDPEEFGEIIIKVGKAETNGAPPPIVRLSDVSRVELGSQQYDQICRMDGMPSVGLAIFQLPGSNALDTAEGIKAKMEELKKRFPSGLDYKIVYDTTPFISQSIEEVFKTLRDAIVLVAIVVLVFLQNWRATIIPLVAVPVAIVGTFAAMAAMGFSLNNLSLFGLVLAIGIVVDDAIVVVENVEHHLAKGLSPRDAAVKAMEEVTGPVIAVALVLCAVFVPCAFISGITGQFFRQFALTIAVSTVISAFNSLTLSPALAAILLKPHGAKRDPLTWLIDILLGWFFYLFNGVFNLSTSIYTWIVGWLLRLSILVLIVYGGLLGATYVMFTLVPFGFIPLQDKGYLLVNVQLPDSASVQRTLEIMMKAEKIARATPGVAHTMAISGQSFLFNANSPNYGSMFVILDDFHNRRRPGMHGLAIMQKLRLQYFKEIDGALIDIFPPPPVDGLGTAGGFKVMIEDRGGLGSSVLEGQTDNIAQQALATGRFLGLFTLFRSNTPQLFIDIDRTKCRSMGIPMKEVFDTLQSYMGSYFINNFNEFGRTWQVNIQADSVFRNHTLDVGKLKVRNDQGEMAPLDTVVEVRDSGGPSIVIRYNLYPAAPINGAAFPTTSSGQIMQMFDQLSADNLPVAMAHEWTEIMYMQILAGNTASIVFALAVILVFLALAAQYESWSLPLAVILVVPMCLLSAVIGVAMVPMDINIFTQIGFVVLVGLASKNAILIVEFARSQHHAGADIRTATIEACRLRLRPIMMTSFAFILGVFPLVVSSGAGAEMRRALGTAVFAGMIGVTIFGIFLTPVFYFVIEWLTSRKARTANSGSHGPDGASGGSQPVKSTH